MSTIRSLRGRPAAKSPMNAKVLRSKLDRFFAVGAELSRLTAESCTWNADTSQHKIDLLMRRSDKLLAEHRALSAMPDVNAAVLKMESKEARP